LAAVATYSDVLPGATGDADESPAMTTSATERAPPIRETKSAMRRKTVRRLTDERDERPRPRAARKTPAFYSGRAGAAPVCGNRWY
jgi:hypothetical protein